jgi:hypothetical protein
LNSATCITGIGFRDPSGLTDWWTGAAGTASQFRYIIDGSILFTGVGHTGNLTRNSFRYPGRQDYNLAVMKRFKMPYAESHNLEFRADMFNVFNHPNTGVSGFDGNLNSTTFLDIPSTRRGGRSISLWLKYNF